MNDPESNSTTRIDKWLWAARAYKTRSIATHACSGGKVSLNDSTAKPHKAVRVGDVVQFRAGTADRRWKVLAIAERRGPASTAQALYQDQTPPPAPRPDRAVLEGRHDGPYREPRSRRPNKRERRQIDKMKRG